MIDLTAFQQLILLDVSTYEHRRGHAPHGLAIKENITRMYRAAGELGPHEEVNHGRLYPNLDTLVERGLLEKSARDKRTNEYALTPDGADAISKLHQLVQIALGEDGEDPYLTDTDPVADGLRATRTEGDD